MATPKNIQSIQNAQNVSTPKNPLTSTPNRVASSPRPHAGTGAFANKTLAYKSPAGKTPASTHGHSHRVSISSQPTSTPLNAPAIHDELLNLNSPAAALIASLGNTGLTPIASGADGLGIATGISSQAVRDALLPPRNPETERLNRLEQVVKLLKTKIAGRGVTREGVERIAQIRGFTILWDEENLTIAGNSVDLEIIFDARSRDTVRDVQLRLNTAGSDEPQLQKDASDILKQHLITSDGQDSSRKHEKETWKSLKGFSADLEYLSQLDYIGSTANGFEIMSSLYDTFRKIWNEEKTRMHDRREAYHVCVGNVGRPLMDGDDCLGITSRYWINRRSYQALVRNSKDGLSMEPKSTWRARFMCQKGNPGISANRNWLANEALRTTVTMEDVFEENQMERPNWTEDNSAAKNADEQKDSDAMLLDGVEDSLDLVFTCELEPSVLLPINVVSELNAQYHMVDMDQSKAIVYQQALLNASNQKFPKEWHASTCWSRKLSVFDRLGGSSEKRHSYSLFSNGIIWSYPVTKLIFNHPRHCTEAIPILRQYALLWSLLRNTISNSGGSAPPQPTGKREKALDGVAKPSIRTRSNKRAARGQLEGILSGRQNEEEGVRVDMSLDVVTDASTVRLEVIVPIPIQSARVQKSSFASVTIEIRRDGIIEIPSLQGLSRTDEEKLRQRATKVLGLSEDVAVLVEWLIGEAHSTS